MSVGELTTSTLFVCPVRSGGRIHDLTLRVVFIAPSGYAVPSFFSFPEVRVLLLMGFARRTGF